MLVGAWCDLLFGLNDEWEVALDAKVDAANADVIMETFFDFEEGSLEESSEESSSEVSESKEKHDSRSDDAIKFEGSTWCGVSREGKFSIKLEEEKDESLQWDDFEQGLGVFNQEYCS